MCYPDSLCSYPHEYTSGFAFDSSLMKSTGWIACWKAIELIALIVWSIIETQWSARVPRADKQASSFVDECTLSRAFILSIQYFDQLAVLEVISPLIMSNNQPDILVEITLE